MKILCVEYVRGIELKATENGLDAWVDWLRDGQVESIEMKTAGGDPALLSDFPEPSTGSVAFSTRACKVVGLDTFGQVADLKVDGADGYRLGLVSSGAKLFEKQGARYVLPLVLKDQSGDIPRGFIETGGQFTGVAGSLLVSQELWDRIEAAGLTGLKVVDAYEVMNLPPRSA